MRQPERFDHEIDHLAHTLREMEERSATTQEWDESPFKWILTQPSATKGAIGRKLAQSLGNFHGLHLEPTKRQNQHYLSLNGALIQVKFSTMWGTGMYRFQQIRDHDYDFCLALGIAPLDINAWLIPKQALDTHVIGTQGQHTGASSSETWWFDVTPQTPPHWLSDFGGTLQDVGDMLRHIAH